MTKFGASDTAVLARGYKSMPLGSIRRDTLTDRV
jgi:hypothetical protein